MRLIDIIADWAEQVWVEALDVWAKGGNAMIAIFAIGLVMFGMGFWIHVQLKSRAFLAVPERKWRRWFDHPLERSPPACANRIAVHPERPTSRSMESVEMQIFHPRRGRHRLGAHAINRVDRQIEHSKPGQGGGRERET